jgi:predicted nucleic acid-binding protein
MSKIFIDTNIWLYAFIESQEKGKSEKSRYLIREREKEIIISYQLINEISCNLLKKAKFSEDDLSKLINSFFRKYIVVDFTQKIILNASSLRDKVKLSIWDSLILATAIDNDCNILYTEDMHHNQLIENKVRIINPFKE